LGPVNLRCIGSDYIISNAHYSIRLHRQGGTIRQLCDAAGAAVVEDHDFYGDQTYFANKALGVSQIKASDDVECGVSLHADKDSLRILFEGQFRGSQRFAIRRPPLLYRNEFVFTAGPTFKETWAFRDNKGFAGQKAFLTMWMPKINADRMRCLRGGQVMADEPLADGNRRRGQLAGDRLPDAIEFSAGATRRLTLSDLALPPAPDAAVFLSGRSFFIPLLGGNAAAMERDKWYEYSATWEVGAR